MSSAGSHIELSK